VTNPSTRAWLYGGTYQLGRKAEETHENVLCSERFAHVRFGLHRRALEMLLVRRRLSEDVEPEMLDEGTTKKCFGGLVHAVAVGAEKLHIRGRRSTLAIIVAAHLDSVAVGR